MTTTTTLNDCELNVPTSDDELNELLAEVRLQTGMDWQIVERHSQRRRLLFTEEYHQFHLYLYTGGVLPWQVIMAGSGETSDCPKRFLYGVIAGMIGANVL